jgi:hypothetical protein
LRIPTDKEVAATRPQIKLKNNFPELIIGDGFEEGVVVDWMEEGDEPPEPYDLSKLMVEPGIPIASWTGFRGVLNIETAIKRYNLMREFEFLDDFSLVTTPKISLKLTTSKKFN